MYRIDLVRKFLELLSIPLLIAPSTLITLWLLLNSNHSTYRWFLVFLMNLILLPTIAVFWLERRKIISDLDLKRKDERLAFLGLVAILSLVNYLDSLALTAPRNIQALNLLAFLIIFAMAVITVFWKVSGHMLILTSFIFLAYIFKGRVALYLMPILPLVAAHRLYFKHHNLIQVLGGIILGFILTNIVFALFLL